ncbi:hypothetical protein QR680_002863 [Steinernema hermaphroditum]|uniref:Uncharacterized protein n=1 Tax=Steinernema hermaphroditum TaxID=289476 RepID=A0AA39H586_9BILA|nr:hypothetical protein QR680_002863 [Steinernema hermaphroditum]
MDVEDQGIIDDLPDSYTCWRIIRISNTAGPSRLYVKTTVYFSGPDRGMRTTVTEIILRPSLFLGDDLRIRMVDGFAGNEAVTQLHEQPLPRRMQKEQWWRLDRYQKAFGNRIS